MDNTSKHVLIPYDLLERLKAGGGSMDKPSVGSDNLDSTLSNVVETEGVSDYEKAIIYQDALKKYLAYRKQNREPFKLNIVDQSKETPPGEIDKQNEDVTNILNSIPKSYRQKGSQILDIIMQNNDNIISWNNQKELVYNNDVIKGSNITDLLYETLRSKGKQLNPVGWNEFITGLARINVPEYLVGNYKNRSLIQDLKTTGIGATSPIKDTPIRKSNKANKGEKPKRVFWESF